MRLNNSKQQLISCKLQRRSKRRPIIMQHSLLFIPSSFIILTLIKYNYMVFVTSFQLHHPTLILQHTNYNNIIGGVHHNNNHDRIQRRRRRRRHTKKSFILLNELPTPSSKYLDHLCDVGVRSMVYFLFFCHVLHYCMYREAMCNILFVSIMGRGGISCIALIETYIY